MRCKIVESKDRYNSIQEIIKNTYQTRQMGFNKIHTDKALFASKANQAIVTSSSKPVRHEVRVLSIKDVDDNRSSAYKYLSLI